MPGAEASEGRSNMLVDDASHSRFAEKYEKNKETLEATEDIQGEVLPAKDILGFVRVLVVDSLFPSEGK